MSTPVLSQEAVGKIYEAHKKGLSIAKAAKYARVSEESVRKYWKMEGLCPHGQKPGELSDEQIRKIEETYGKGIGICQAARYAGVSKSSVVNRWSKIELDGNNRNINTESVTEDLFSSK